LRYNPDIRHMKLRKSATPIGENSQFWPISELSKCREQSKPNPTQLYGPLFNIQPIQYSICFYGIVVTIRTICFSANNLLTVPMQCSCALRLILLINNTVLTARRVQCVLCEARLGVYVLFRLIGIFRLCRVSGGWSPTFRVVSIIPPMPPYTSLPMDRTSRMPHTWLQRQKIPPHVGIEIPVDQAVATYYTKLNYILSRQVKKTANLFVYQNDGATEPLSIFFQNKWKSVSDFSRKRSTSQNRKQCGKGYMGGEGGRWGLKRAI